jgi:7-cyano-7-deazaguanine synthase
LDSTVLTYWLRSQGVMLTLLSVYYGHRHRVEVDCARATAARLGSAHHVVDLSASRSCWAAPL